ncbi:RNA polymerase III subunit C [Choristoneura fumiferana]|uniref:RNA polymerase III subunit C n=1 Tax=Choristoneura fumiferana TaxID=7141 RepID=UPI003D15EE95
MSHQLGRVVSEILLRYYGEIVQQVGNDLFTYGSKTITMIMRSTGLPRSQVIESLRTLIKYDLALFEPSANEVIADYKLIPDNVLLLIRYPRYLLQMKSKYGSEAELLIEELLQQAASTATGLLLAIANKYKDDKEKNISIITLKDTFVSLATAGYIQQAPVAEMKEGSEIPTLVPVATIVPELDGRALVQAMTSGNTADMKDNVYWKVNYDRFHLDFRDDVMIKAITRRIDENAGELMRHLLEQMYLSSAAWAPESNPAPALELKERARRGDRPQLHQHLDQYLKVLEENGAGFVSRCGDAGGGQWVVRVRRAAQETLCAVLDHTVTERLGSKAARIFRLIRAKKYIEEEDIQKYAMLPNKECKELTYKLLEEHFISVQPMRKAASAGGMAKAIYLYHIDLHEVALLGVEMCYRSLHNLMLVAAHERRRHARLLDKRRRVRSIVHGMRARGEPQDNIDDVEETITPPEHAVLQGVEKRIKQLSAAELELDKTLFILNWFLTYPRN